MIDKISEINPDAVVLLGFDSEIIGLATLIDGKVTIKNPITEEIVFEYVIKNDEEDFEEEETTIEALWDRTAFENIIAYDTDKIIEKLAKDMDYDEASEYFYFNIAGGYLGATTPIFKTNLT